MALCVVTTDSTGTPSVIGPFENDEEALAFANKVSKDYVREHGASYFQIKIAQINPPQEA